MEVTIEWYRRAILLGKYLQPITSHAWGLQNQMNNSATELRSWRQSLLGLALRPMIIYRRQMIDYMLSWLVENYLSHHCLPHLRYNVLTSLAYILLLAYHMPLKHSPTPKRVHIFPSMGNSLEDVEKM